MKKKGFWIVAIILILAVSGFFAYRTYASNQSESATQIQTATVEEGALSSTLSASGTASSSRTATVTWQVSGKVGEVDFQVGDMVSTDQELAALDLDEVSSAMLVARQNLLDAQEALDDLMNTSLQQAQALEAVNTAQMALDGLNQTAAQERSQAQLALANAQEALQDAQKARNNLNYSRAYDPLVVEKAQTDYLLAKEEYKEAYWAYNKLSHKNLTNLKRAAALTRVVAAKQIMDSKLAIYNWYLLEPTELDIAKADAVLEVAKADLAKAELDWEALSENSDSVSITLAKATLENAQREWDKVKNGPSEEKIALAQAAVDNAQAVLNQFNLEAPFSGTITQVDVQAGDLVNSGDSAFRIDDLATIYVELQISEIDLADLKVGQPVTLEFDAIPDKEFQGEVTEIGLVANVSQGVVNFPVTVQVENVDGDIRPGMTASASIQTNRVADVLYVPNRALTTVNGRRAVTVLFEGQQISVPVTVGLITDTYSEIISDQLRVGDVVVINGSSVSTASDSNGNTVFRGPGGGVFEGPPGGFP